MAYSPKEILKLSGRTGLGKNRISEHGTLWQVQLIRGSDALLKSIRTGYLKWIGPNYPNDFDVRTT